jgi:L-ribulokinase
VNHKDLRCVIGVDFGTLSARAVVVHVADGTELGTGVAEYPHGVIEQRLPDGATLPPSWALQDPRDWWDTLGDAVRKAVSDSGVDPRHVVGIATDFTACTVLPTDVEGTPLCQLPGLEDRPHAWPKLWKHHAAQPQADRINAVAAEQGEDWLALYGGRISSEWQFAKALQVLEEAPEIYERTERWIEAADWIVWQLSGVETRNACTAGYKGIFQDGRYPDAGFLAALHPGFADFASTRLDTVPLTPLGHRAGSLTDRAAAHTGLPAGIAVAIGNVDAHVTAPAAQAVEAGQMTAIMGTSTCHVMNSDRRAEVAGMCGVVDGGIVEGLWGYEAGQSGVGDIFGWFVRTCVPGSYERAAETRGITVHEYLTELAAQQAIGEHGLVALDWHSGNRSVLVDHELSGLVVGQTLATAPEDTYRALLEATAFGTRRIIEAFREAGVPVEELVVAGGLLKNALLMQIYADVTRLPLSLIASEQGPALGSAIHAAVAAGCYDDVRAAAAAMGGRSSRTYRPDEARAARYDELYAEYLRLHDHFGRLDRQGSNPVMHRLGEIRRAATTEKES